MSGLNCGPIISTYIHKPELTALDTGYWHYRINGQQFIQWPMGEDPQEEHGFPPGGEECYGPTKRQIEDAKKAVKAFLDNQQGETNDG